MSYNQLVCLVGENPMPVYLGIAQFAAQGATIVLVCSKDEPGAPPGTIGVAERIRALFQECRGDLRFPPLVILDNPYDPRGIRANLQRLAADYPTAALNYTGGTKVMSSFSVLPWLIRKDRDGRLSEELATAFYLEEDSARFHFNDSSPVDLSASVDLREIRILHDVQPMDTGRRMGTSVSDLVGVFRRQTENYISFALPEKLPIKPETDAVRTTLLSCLTAKTRAAWEEAPPPTSNNMYRQSELRSQFKFFHGLWLEDLVEEIFRRITPEWTLECVDETPKHTLLQPAQIASGQNFRSQGQQFELDVVICHNSRLFVFSMTTDNKQDRCRSKMFEAYHRARQVGGSLARSAVVCLAGEDVVENCFASLGKNRRNRIFGKDSIHRWISGEPQALNALRSFMEGD